MVGSLLIGGQIRQTHIGLRKINNYEQFINPIDKRYASEDAFFIA